VLDEIRGVLTNHKKIETDTVRVRLIEVTSSALNVELVSYVLTRDFNEFAEVREDLLLQIMTFVEDSGTTLASSVQTLLLSGDAGLKKEKIAAPEKSTDKPSSAANSTDHPREAKTGKDD
jgi:MscS family membrane protein